MEAHHWHDVTVLMIPIAGVWSKLTCAGLKTSWAHRRQDVTMLAISITGIRSIKSSCSGYSGCVADRRQWCLGTHIGSRGLPRTLGDVSVCDTKKRQGGPPHHPITGWL